MPTHHERPTLPSIHDLIRVPQLEFRLNAARDFSQSDSWPTHEATCDTTSVQIISQLHQPVNSQGSKSSLWADIEFGSSSSSSIPEAYSDSGSSTLVNSRHPSAEDFGVAAKFGKRSKQHGSVANIRKNRNEQIKRGELADRIQGIEDIVGLYYGNDSYPIESGQSRGNGRRAGLLRTKISNLTIGRALLARLLDDKYKKAIEEDQEDEFRAWLRTILQLPHDKFTVDTFMQGGYDMSPHPQEDDNELSAVECRKTALQQTFAESVRQFRAKITSLATRFRRTDTPCEIDTD